MHISVKKPFPSRVYTVHLTTNGPKVFKNTCYGLVYKILSNEIFKSYF